ncbi:MAG TPA: 16S rRNA (guanine(966)-N(2))-methyltransferase RsmD [Chloroflexia bacterium]|nr:16S rRNA (guanine(966)-N(2))-methyltransferase RsmD [Chloroflexia bacterium]
MRVIAGSAKGRQLKAPPTMGTRPMTDRLKTSLFDTLTPFGIAGARVLDLYAGSGSLGIEMLSRGADWCDFVEQNAGVARIIQENLRNTRMEDRARVYKMTVERFLSTAGGDGEATGGTEYDIITLDPPYADPGIERTLETVATRPILAADGLVVIGHATQVKLADEYGGGRIKRVRHRVMGGSAFSIYEAAGVERTGADDEGD